MRGGAKLGGRAAALVALVLTGAALALAVVLTTPWHPLPGRSGGVAVSVLRDFTRAEVTHEEAYHRAALSMGYLSLAVSLVLAAVLGLTPAGARLVAAAARPFGGGWVARLVLGVVVISLLGSLAALPTSARAEAVRRRYGLSTQHWPGWWADQAKSFVVNTVLLLVVVAVLYVLIRLLPRFWWLPTAVSVGLLVVLASFVYPVLVEPVFNKFTPMPDGPLRSSLLQLAESDHVPVADVLVADASRRTTALNAYVSGFGATRRIVVYDTTVAKASPDEVRLIVAHELGHAKRNDVLRGTLVAAVGLSAGVIVLYLLCTWPALLRRAGVESVGDPRSLALVLLVATVIGTLASPVQQLMSRRIEARADVHALNLTRDPDTFARMQRRLALTNLSDLDPGAVAYALFASHPTGPERIAMARDWALEHGLPQPPNLAGR